MNPFASNRQGWLWGPRIGASLGALALALLVALALGGPSASAQPPELWDRCLGTGAASTGAGQCVIPRGVAAEPEEGRVYVVDQSNFRVNVFSPLGEFVRSWGWGVLDGSAELQVCTGETGCQKGLSGPGAGQLGSGPQGIAVDSPGNIYVADRGNRRVQKFSPAGEFLLMFGGEVNKTTGADVCTKADLEGSDECGAGVTGTGEGEFQQWPVSSNIAVGPGDEVWVGDKERIQRFDAAGAYQGEIELPGEGFVATLAADPETGDLYAGFANSSTGFNPQADLLKLSPAGAELGTVTVASPHAIAVDAARELVVVSGASQPTIRKFDPTGLEVEDGEYPFVAEDFNLSTGIATNLCAGSEAPGNLYVANANFNNSFVRAYGTPPVGCLKARTLPASEVEETTATLNGSVNPKGEPVTDCFFEWGTDTEYGEPPIDCAEVLGTISEASEPVPVHADLSGLGGATTYHFRLNAEVGGKPESGLDEAFKTKGPPVISDEHVLAATQRQARVRALVNPEGLPTSCSVRYGVGGAFDQSTAASEVGSDRSEHPAQVLLDDLDPGTTYRWRFLCENTAVLDEGITEGAALTLHTYRLSRPPAPCPNDIFRTGPSATLPDCRAYELVSPVDKNGGDVTAGVKGDGNPGGLAQSALDGDKVAYTAEFAAFGAQSLENSSRFNPYIARRSESSPREAGDGWASEGTHQPYEGRRVASSVPGAPRELMALTDDLCSAWMVDYQTPALGAGIDDYANLLRRDNCDPSLGDFEALTTAEPPEGTGINYVGPTSVQGHSADGAHALFVADAKLTPEAAGGANAQVYDRFGGSIRLVSVLPDGGLFDPEPGDGEGFANPSDAAVGSGWNNNLEGAVSEDGSVAYWTAGGSTGQIYARLGPGQGIVAGECEAPGAPCTVPVSAGAGASFWQGSPDGSRALYSEGNLLSGSADLFLFDLASGESTLIAEDVQGVAGASEELERVYFVSDTALAEAGANGEGEEAVAEEPNLYLAEGGEVVFVGTLTEGDMGEAEPDVASENDVAYDLAARESYFRATRTTPSGSLAFQSRAPLTGYDNIDPATGKAAVEVFLYEPDGGELECVSCNPSGARPQAREMTSPYQLQTNPLRRRTKVPAAAWIPTWQQPTHASNVISADGNRVFFNSNDALVPQDANGAQDVYEWEAAGSGSCNEADPSFSPQNGGCLYLISSGESSFESEFWEASPDGDDVFFTTDASLVGKDPGSIDLYDARVGGGFPEPEPRSECEGEACQSPPPPPVPPAPASGAYSGPGNLPNVRNCRANARRAANLSRRSKRTRRGAKRARMAGKRAAARRMQRRAKRLTRGARKQSRTAKRCRRQNRRNAR